MGIWTTIFILNIFVNNSIYHKLSQQVEAEQKKISSTTANKQNKQKPKQKLT